MAWYVFALVDAIPSGQSGRGLTGALSVRMIAGAYVVVERRADVPPVEFGTLEQHQAVVDRLARHVPAILPVRFGTLLEPDHLEEAMLEREEDIADAFDLVRGRVQFTWRVKRRQPEAGGRRLEAADRKSDDGARQPKSGAEYLRRAARAANPPPPAAFRPLRTKLSGLMAAQRYQPPGAALPEAVYHLVEKKKADRYVAAAAALTRTHPQLTVSGPFPPFAFAPEIL